MTAMLGAAASAGKQAVRWKMPVVLIGLLSLIAIFAPILAPYSDTMMDNYDAMINRAPSLAHPFGTDPLGRDVLSRVIYGSRVSLSLAVAAALLAVGLATCYGSLAGLIGGTVDRVLMRALDVALSIPRLLLLLAVTALWQGLPLWGLIVLLGCTGWFDVARLVRGEVQALRGRDYIAAAVATGVPRVRVFTRHVLPHLVPILIVSTTLNVSSTIALEAGLSFLGLGIQPPDPSWGTIMKDGADAMGALWWLTLFPGVTMIIAVFSCHALGDALRDLFAMDQVPA